MPSTPTSSPAGPEGLNTGVRYEVPVHKVSSPKHARGRWLRGLRIALSVVSLLLAAGAAAVYGLRPARLDPITLLPVWLWIVPGLLLSLAALSRRTLVWSLAAAAAWGVFAGCFAEEPRFLLRSLERSLRPPAGAPAAVRRGLRVVTLNCDRGNLQAIAVALAQDADIVLLEEIPQRRELRAIAGARPGWEVVATSEVAILVRGRAQLIPVSMLERGYMCPALVWPARLSNSGPVFVVGAHLTEPVPHTGRAPHLSWSETLRIQTVREGQMARVANLLSRAPAGCPVIVGGDFNAPAADRLYAPLAGQLRDAFAEAGLGWPNTYPSRWPLVRIDRIWTDRRFTVAAARVVRSEHSDHRMVVVDFTLPDE